MKEITINQKFAANQTNEIKKFSYEYRFCVYFYNSMSNKDVTYSYNTSIP